MIKALNMRTESKMLGLAAALILAACSAESSLPLGALEQPLSALKVAALQYGAGDHPQVDATCAAEQTPDFCAVQAMIAQAQAQGATLVVTPENELGQKYYEADPQLGQLPAQDTGLTKDSMIKQLSQQAQQLKIYLVVHLATSTGSGSSAKKYSTQVAFDPAGKVVGKHHKFELYSGEKKTYTAGTDVSTFTSPAGKVGLLICADMYGDPRLSDKLTRTLGARMVALSTWWTVADGTRWQASFAKNWGVYLVASNTTSGAGHGGGIFGPDGEALDLKKSGKPELAIATISATP